MIKIRALFIGGPADGKRMEIDARCQQISIPELSEPMDVSKLPVIPRGTDFNFTLYRVHILEVRGHGHIAICTTGFDLNHNDLLVALLEGYRPMKEDQL